MSELISGLIAILTYFVLFKLLFEDLNEFAEKLKSTLYLSPIALILDFVINWSPSFRKLSLRILFWLPSGLLTGLMAYVLLR